MYDAAALQQLHKQCTLLAVHYPLETSMCSIWLAHTLLQHSREPSRHWLLFAFAWRFAIRDVASVQQPLSQQILTCNLLAGQQLRPASRASSAHSRRFPLRKKQQVVLFSYAKGRARALQKHPWVSPHSHGSAAAAACQSRYLRAQATVSAYPGVKKKQQVVFFSYAKGRARALQKHPWVSPHSDASSRSSSAAAACQSR